MQIVFFNPITEKIMLNNPDENIVLSHSDDDLYYNDNNRTRRIRPCKDDVFVFLYVDTLYVLIIIMLIIIMLIIIIIMMRFMNMPIEFHPANIDL